MSVINRIEVANLLNKHGDIASPWDAKMRHLLLDLRGQSSAISMENGFGKTTLAEALIGLLSRDRSLISRTRRKCSPSTVAGQGRSWSHLRVEFRTRSGSERQDDMLAAAGEEVAGETFVFGFYGYSDGSGLAFYHYAGRLEDIPVHHYTVDGKLALSANSDVKADMANRGVRLTHNREEWLDAVGAHVSRRELAQLAAFQKEGGADKSQIFNAIKPRGGEKADQAFFFEVLAPEILSGATRGETDESEELIEEVILNSGTNITELRHRLEEAEHDQRRAEDKVARLATLSDDGAALLAARDELERLDAGFQGLECLLGGQALLGLPGIPATPAEVEDETLDAAIPCGFAWASGDTRRPRVSLWLLARLSGGSERSIRQALSERGARVDAHRRLVHLPEAAWPAGREIGHVDFTAAREWLAETLNFDDDAARHRALAALDAGADVFEARDGNRFREEVIADQTYRDELGADIQAAERHLETLEQQRERLEGQQREFVDNQSFYTQALSEGLFDEAELEAPEATAEAAKAEAESARQALNAHLGRIGELKQVAAWHAEFQQQAPGVSPGERLAEKQARDEVLEEAHAEAEAQREPLASRCETLRHQAEALRDEQQRLAGEQGLLEQGQAPWRAFVDGWPEEDVTGFWTRRKTALAELETRCHGAEQRAEDARREQARLTPLHDAAQRYADYHGDDEPVHLRQTLYERARALDDEGHRLEQEQQRLRELTQAQRDFASRFEADPERWLRDAQRRYPRLLSEADALDDAIEERWRYLDSLAGDPLERRAVEAEAQQCLDAAEIAWQPLHAVLNDAEVERERRRGWLSQAAGLLFSPVVAGDDEAERAARCLIDAGLALPVFESARLTALLEADQPPLGAVQGSETLAVKAALDPRYLEELRRDTERRLSADRERRAALAAECERLDPHGDVFALALKAREAQQADAETALATLDERQQQLDARQAELTPRLTEAALNCIDDYQRYLQAGGQAAVAQAEAALEEAERDLADCRPAMQQAAEELETHGATWLAAERFADAGGIERLEALKARLETLETQLGEIREQLAEAERDHEAVSRRLHEIDAERRSLFDDGERDRLRALAEFEADGGDAFMATAEAVQEELEAALETASRRARFDFSRLRAYLDVRDASGGSQKLERDIAAAKRAYLEAREGLKAQRRERDEVEARLAEQRRAMEWVDQLAIAWLGVMRELPEGWARRLAALDDLAAASHWPLDDPRHETREAALATWHAQAGMSATLSLSDLEACQQTLLDALAELNLGERARNRERQDKTVRGLERRLAQALEAAAESRAFSETERARLAALKGVTADALDDLAGLHGQLDTQLEEHRQRVARLHASREQIEGTLVERLSSIISDAAGNLDILKRVARSHGEGGAYFEVKAALIDGESLRELITTLLADIDEHQAALKRRAERDGGMSEGDSRRRDDDLVRQIRRRIYRGLFHEVSIRLKHDAIRPHGRLFSLNEDMSEGQREAVSLMWLVKLSEFAIERELRELPGHHKRRARASRESVILLDGLFSKLSHRRLIQDSLESLRNTRGRFQMIGLIHNPNYENDPAIFPTYLVGSVIGGVQGQGGHVMVRDGQVTAPEALGRAPGEASLFGIHVKEPMNAFEND